MLCPPSRQPPGGVAAAAAVTPAPLLAGSAACLSSPLTALAVWNSPALLFPTAPGLCRPAAHTHRCTGTAAGGRHPAPTRRVCSTCGMQRQPAHAGLASSARLEHDRAARVWSAGAERRLAHVQPGAAAGSGGCGRAAAAAAPGQRPCCLPALGMAHQASAAGCSSAQLQRQRQQQQRRYCLRSLSCGHARRRRPAASQGSRSTAAG